MNRLNNEYMENDINDIDNINNVDNINYVNNINHVNNINYVDIVNDVNNTSSNNHNNQTHKWFNNPIFNRIFFNIKNNNYEILIMWFLFIVTIIILLSLVISDIDDRLETERVI